MGKAQKKTGKGRLDKYYHLAKEQGYRARSAYKLIQLNKKYGFLEKARVLIDLCAAPGGWLQVAAKYMPMSSLIIGVDLAPIKPIPNIITFQDDITTERCRQNLRSELKTWKCDVVLHDGAPNVGTAWIQDAFTQAELVLMSFKLASEFLNKGGTFVTKVFRSKDYNNLLWVFQQLFTKVEATKPPSSRNVSAEIFVVCRDFLAPKKIDPRFFDPKWVFSDLDLEPTNKQNDVFRPEKKKRQREGYEEGNYTLHKKVPAIEFVKSQDPIQVLGSYNAISFDDEESRSLLKHQATTPDIIANCEDLKVLGKRDFKDLLKWRSNLRDEHRSEKKEETEVGKNEEKEEARDSADEDEEIQKRLDDLVDEEALRKKRAKKKANEKKQKLIQRLQLNMIVPTDIGLEQDAPGETLFSLAEVDKAGAVKSVRHGHMETDDGEVDQQVNGTKDARKANGNGNHPDDEMEDMEGSEFSNDYSDDDDEDNDDDGPMIVDFDESKADLSKPTKGGLSKRARMFFDNPLFKNAALDDDEEEKGEGEEDEEEAVLVNGQTNGVQKNGTKPKYEEWHGFQNGRAANASDADSDSESDSDFEVVPAENGDTMWDGVEGDDVKAVENARAQGLNSAEAMTLAMQYVNREKTKSDLVDEGFNKRAFWQKEGLPKWFLEEEEKHNKLNLPVTKEAMDAFRERMKALDARPIKKIAEAKARKKQKAATRMEKLQKKANDIVDNPDMTEKEKSQSIQKMLSKAAKKKPKKEVQLVVAKNSNRGLKGRPKGVKGRYKMVDARMKKEVRAMKRIEKRTKKKRH